MDTEELLYIKKKYEESLSAAKKLIKNDPDHILYEDDIRNLFSELKESEDEKIRNEIIAHIKDQQYSFISAPDCRDEYEEEEYNRYNSWIDWLEKHKERTEYPTEVIENAVSALHLRNNGMPEEEARDIVNSIVSIINPEHWPQYGYKGKPFITPDAIREGMTKYGITQYQLDNWLKKYINVVNSERTKTKEIEPKFRVGDWLIRKDIVTNPSHIVDIKKPYYYLTEAGSFILFEEQGKYRSWALSDAKDGDILCAYQCNEPKTIFINKGEPKKNYALMYYVYYSIMNTTLSTDDTPGCISYAIGFNGCVDIRPATNAQRNVLYKKLYEYGYEWDETNHNLIKK